MVLDVSAFVDTAVGVMELPFRYQYTAKLPVPPVITAFTVNGLPYIMLFDGVAVRVIYGAGSTVIVFATALNVTGVLALSTATTLNVYDPGVVSSNGLKVIVFGSQNQQVKLLSEAHCQEHCRLLQCLMKGHLHR